MIEISQQNVAVLLIIAIQALVVGGLVACIVIGPQDGSSLVPLPSGGLHGMDGRPEPFSPTAYPAGGLSIGILAAPSGGTTISFSSLGLAR